MNSNIINKTDDKRPITHQFYIVSPKKFIILFLGTMGLYLFYWFYKHYSLYFKSEGTTTSPILIEVLSAMIGALLSIVFVYQLFSAFEKQAKAIASYNKSLSGFAILYIIVIIAEKVLARYLESGLLHILIYPIAIFVTCWLLFNAQKVANMACQDSNGTANSNLTKTNYFWLFIGSILWTASIFDTFSALQNI